MFRLQPILVLLNVVALLAHVWGGCCAHHDHTDHVDFQSEASVKVVDSEHAHEHHHNHHEGRSSKPRPVHGEPCECGCDIKCPFDISLAVSAPTPELYKLLGTTILSQNRLSILSLIEQSFDRSRPPAATFAGAARLQKPLQVWLV